MKTFIFRTVVSCVIFIAFFSSCRKFEEGGPVRKAEDNLTTEWIMERAFKNGSSVEIVNENPQIGEVTEDWHFGEDGTMRKDNGSYMLYGSWKLVNKKKSIEITITSPSSNASTITYDIVMLDELRMAWEHTYEGNSYRYELKSAR